MATKDDSTTKAAPAKAAAEKTADPKSEPKAAAAATDERVSTCVVNNGRGTHVGDAVNGKVCSYHAMHYDARGNRR
jgi:hypothetical protein